MEMHSLSSNATTATAYMAKSKASMFSGSQGHGAVA